MSLGGFSRPHHICEFSKVRLHIREYICLGLTSVLNEKLPKNVPAQEVTACGKGVPVAEHLEHCEVGSLEH